MKLRIAIAMIAAAVPTAVLAESWKEVDRLAGDVSVELDEDSVAQAMDGANEVIQATFRRQMPTGIMESDVAIDCANQSARLRGLRTITAGEVYNQQISQTTDFHEVSFGSGDAIYFKALCGKDIPPPEGYASEEEPVLEDAAPNDDAHPLDENPDLEGDGEAGAE